MESNPKQIYRYGRPAYLDEEAKIYRYESDGSPVGLGNKPCPKCGKYPKDYSGQDPCIAELPGVFRACCGHGIREGHIKFVNGVVIKGTFRSIIDTRPYTPKEIEHEKGRAKRNDL